MNTILLLPVYRPGQPLLSFLDELLADGRDPAAVVTVDDGSGPAADAVLAAARRLGCTVLRGSGSNKGKGVALKRGFRYAATTFPDADVVTADGDGQHRADDIRAVEARAGHGDLVLGVRPFDRMPLRSRVGNTVIGGMFRWTTGVAVSDTQTGFRAYPSAFVAWLCTLPGARFDYEMTVLATLAGGDVPIVEVPVPARYPDGGAGSNFGGLADSVRVVRSLRRYSRSSPIYKQTELDTPSKHLTHE